MLMTIDFVFFGHTSCALKGEQSDVDDAEGTVTLKEFRFGRNFG
jgi:hypothetical protein